MQEVKITPQSKKVSYSGKVYSDYLQCLSNEERKHSQIINSTLSELNAMLSLIEQNFKKDIAGIKTIRKNRFIDKYFWVLGQGK